MVTTADSKPASESSILSTFANLYSISLMGKQLLYTEKTAESVSASSTKFLQD